MSHTKFQESSHPSWLWWTSSPALAGFAVAAILGGTACAAGPIEDGADEDMTEDEALVDEAEQALSSSCVPGTATHCGGSDPLESWTGKKCCVAHAPSCGPGTPGQCGVGDPREHWTGLVCCVEDQPVCTTGLPGHCGGNDEKEHWTGVQCCVDAHPLCAPGKVESCGAGDPKEHWTGNKCCVEASSCSGGTAASCTGPGKHWTGFRCCTD